MAPRLIPKREPRIPFTKQGYEKVLQDIQTLQKDRPSAVENLRKAREMGDLSENGYYKAARARLSSIDANLRKLDRLRKLGVVVSSEHNGCVDIGSTVALKDESGVYTYTIVGGYESDPKNHTISHLSPLGKALMGKKVGDTSVVRAPVGEKLYDVIAIT